jgi:hypothetical protein
MAALQRAAQSLADCPAIEAEFWHCQVRYYLPLIERASSARPSAASLPARRCRPATSWSACSRPMPISSSRAAAMCIAATSSTWPPAAAA